MGNISKVVENGTLQATYEYDKINRLIRENNKQLGKSYFFEYDNEGNITSKHECNYTLLPKDEIAELDTFEYSYLPNSDQLARVNDSSFAYDSIGNATTWNGKTATYSKGRQLASFDGTTFTYNGLGQRTSKAKNNVTINFTYDSNGKLISQSNGLEFIYDTTGVSGFMYNGNIYHYRKNLQKDITHILDNNGNIVVKYTYDAWGNYSITYGESNALAELNPFRYRSYYYDTETSLYYLKTRYYDPEIGRFITIDDTQYLAPDQINGLNLYAYCGNNPIMNIDPNGNAWWNPADWNWQKIGIAATIVGALLLVGAITVLTMGVGTTVLAGTLTGAVLHGAAVGALIGAGVGIAAGGLIGGAITGWSAEGILTGMAVGFGVGAVIGAVVGGAIGAVSYTPSGLSRSAINKAVKNIMQQPNKVSHIMNPKHNLPSSMKEVAKLMKKTLINGKIGPYRTVESVFWQVMNSEVTFKIAKGVIMISDMWIRSK